MHRDIVKRTCLYNICSINCLQIRLSTSTEPEHSLSFDLRRRFGLRSPRPGHLAARDVGRCRSGPAGDEGSRRSAPSTSPPTEPSRQPTVCTMLLELQGSRQPRSATSPAEGTRSERSPSSGRWHQPLQSGSVTQSPPACPKDRSPG